MSFRLPAPDSGTVARSSLSLIDSLPTGEQETAPVIVANGADPGPTVWVTGSIHGDEVTALAVCQDIVHADLVDDLAGRLVVIPTLNPAGLRRTRRTSYYDDDEDPNRLFPDSTYVQSDSAPEDTVEGPRPPSQQEIVCRRIFDCFADDADALLDIHTAFIDSHPFLIQDRVLYDRGLRDRATARDLAEDTTSLAASMGLPVVFEYPPAEYLAEELHRSASGSALNAAGIPALTVELGSHSVVDDQLHAQGVAAVYRAMEHLGMLSDAPTAFPPPFETVPTPVEAPMDGQVRRYVGPHVPVDETGIIRHEAAPGDVVATGETVARVVSPTGNPSTATSIPAEHDSWVLARTTGVAGYEHTAVTWLAIEDDSSPIGTPPESGEPAGSSAKEK